MKLSITSIVRSPFWGRNMTQACGIPISLGTVLVTIATRNHLPVMFNRMSVAREQLATEMGSAPVATASNELRGRFYYEDALIAHADGDAAHERRSLREVARDAPPSWDMNEVRERLTKLGN
jgi:hypothetical protein